MRLGILGAGGWGKNLVRVFCDLLGQSAVVVVDPDEDRREAMQAQYPEVGTASAPGWDGLDAAVIAAPAVLHFDLAREALAHGVHVLVEKPITLTAAEASQLIELADEKNRVLMVDHLLEYHPAVVRLKEIVEEGRLGRLLHLTSRRLNLGVIRSEENVLWSLAPHDISIILYMLERNPSFVLANGAAYLQPGIADLAHISMEFSDGASAHVHVSWLDPVKTRSLSVVGELGMAIYDDMAEDTLVFHNKRAIRDEGRLIPERGEAVPVALEEDEPLRSMAEAFLHSIDSGQAPKTDGRDGLRVVRVLEAAQASMDAGGAPIRLELNE